MFATEYIANKKGERKESKDKKERKVARFSNLNFKFANIHAHRDSELLKIGTLGRGYLFVRKLVCLRTPLHCVC